MGTLSLAAPLLLFEKCRLWAGTGFNLLPFFHHHPTQHNCTTQTVTHTVTLTSTFSRTLAYTATHPTCNVVCPSGAWFENRPHLTPSVHLAWNPEACNSAVSWHWNTHTFYFLHATATSCTLMAPPLFFCIGNIFSTARNWKICQNFGKTILALRR